MIPLQIKHMLSKEGVYLVSLPDRIGYTVVHVDPTGRADQMALDGVLWTDGWRPDVVVRGPLTMDAQWNVFQPARDESLVTVSADRHNYMTASGSESCIVIKQEAFNRARAMYGTESFEDDTRLYRALQAYLLAAAPSAPQDKP